jgi:hypothetical protein
MAGPKAGLCHTFVPPLRKIEGAAAISACIVAVIRQLHEDVRIGAIAIGGLTQAQDETP